MKKKVLGISIGVVVVILAIIGAVLLQKQASEKKKITAAQNEIAAIEKTTAKDGELSKDVAALYEDKQEFLNKEIKPATIKETKEKLLKKQTEIEKIKREYGKKVTADKAETNIQVLQKKTALANDKLEIQTKTNELFSSKEPALKGDNVKDQLPITVDLKKEKITTVTDELKDNKELKGKWQEAIESILKNATEQVDQVEKIKKLLNESFDGNVPKETVQKSNYDTLNKEIEKVKNEELKTTFTAKLILMKAMIDTQGQINALTQQQKAAEQEVNNALEKAKADANKAVEQATGDDKMLLGYSDDQIEYARVWLTLIGVKPSELHAKVIPAGTPLNPYDAGSVTYPTDAIMLYGGYSAEGQIVYTSNRNGTINVYPVPSHWQIGAEVANDPEKVRALTQGILDQARVVSVDVGNPRDVVDLIRVQK
ncbi:hypothetical protein JZO66_04055 [Enterococcus sp. DIV0242_7C1]|uniref:Uncharacterized protein n=1 Tax=Candidatus Enterococcus dunnyi TaxID=1834192 RepID=A0A200JCT2_9ENTE|nr:MULTISPECIES: hypothetical protein [unclassified Enterococcus]MBO0469708.1 hypothetical protein [Enterococcus sp. DIV0242_7C1]OUZ35004.1 hypothetical protein A5889_000479 [Enterococcus sp. 9D6_DIV0238]